MDFLFIHYLSANQSKKGLNYFKNPFGYLTIFG
ncbi:hypothetical protein BH09BAC4_BH09BAC4_12600 [soil metagenome]